MGDTIMAKHLNPGHIVETPDGLQFTVEGVVPFGEGVEVIWTDGMVEQYAPDATFDVIGEQVMPTE